MEIGIKPVQIMKFLQVRGMLVSTLQVQWMIKRQHLVEFENQTEQLRSCIDDCPGPFVEFFEAAIDEEQHRSEC